MKIELSNKNYKPNERLEELVLKKVGKLEKYLTADARVKVFFKEEKVYNSIEITVQNGKDILRSEVRGTNMFDNLDGALKKIERQIVHSNTRKDTINKKQSRNNELEYLFSTFIEDPVPTKIVKTKTFELEPISIETAIANLEMLDHNFYVFLNEKTKTVNVIYRRQEGDYGLIEAII